MRLGARLQLAAEHRDPKGDYFMLGDNRGASDDSRFYGPVPGSPIPGPVVLIDWPTNRVVTP